MFQTSLFRLASWSRSRSIVPQEKKPTIKCSVSAKVINWVTQRRMRQEGNREKEKQKQKYIVCEGNLSLSLSLSLTLSLSLYIYIYMQEEENYEWRETIKFFFLQFFFSGKNDFQRFPDVILTVHLWERKIQYCHKKQINSFFFFTYFSRRYFDTS